jgi:glycogen synthase
VAELQAARPGVVLISAMLPKADVVQLLSHATVFVCPSVYEPLGIVNLEAMACGTAVVASDVGGIPEVVVDGATGRLVHYDEADPHAFEAGLAGAVAELLADPPRAAELGRAGRQRAVAEFGWDAIAEQTLALYRSVQALARVREVTAASARRPSVSRGPGPAGRAAPREDVAAARPPGLGPPTAAAQHDQLSRHAATVPYS